MYGYLKTANEAGFVANVHAIGTKGTSLMLDTYERLIQDLGRLYLYNEALKAYTINNAYAAFEAFCRKLIGNGYNGRKKKGK